MVKLVNRAKMTTSTTGTGTITLGSPSDGYQTFAAAGVSNSDTVRYTIEDGNAWEIGTGTYTSSGTTLSRTVSESSNSGNALNLSGNAVVFVTAIADDVGVRTYATISAMTSSTAASSGALAFVTANSGLYQNNGNGWYKVATVNTSPAISSVSETTSGSTTALSNSGTFALTAGANTVVTITASDADEGTDLTYTHTVTSGTESNVATITQGTGASENVFTFAPATSVGGTITVRFDVTDNTNTAQFTNSFSLSFGVAVSYSNKTFSVGSQESQPFAFAFNDDGTKLFAAGWYQDTVFRYSLSTAYDISTASYDNNSKDCSGDVGNIRHLEFNSNGTKMYVLDSSNDDITTYTLNPAYDVSSASSPSTWSISSNLSLNGPFGFRFYDSGGKVLFFNGSIIKTISLTTAYDFSGGFSAITSNINLYTLNSYNLSGLRSFDWGTDGTKLLAVGGSGSDPFSENLVVLELSTAYDLTTLSYDQSDIVAISSSGSGSNARQSNITNMSISPDGSKLYVLSRAGTATNSIDQYALSNA